MRLHAQWLWLSLILAGCSYLPEGLEVQSGLGVVETPDYIALLPEGSDLKGTGFMFYPGGLVDPHAYIEAFEELALVHEYPVVILKVSANLAIWNGSKALQVQKQLPEVEKWVISGHSLGGVVACTAVANEPDAFAGLIVMAAYSISPLGDWPEPVMVILAEFDGEDLEIDLQENAANLPPRQDVASVDNFPFSSTADSTIHTLIKGGNHAQFGSYGPQKGDGEATISREAQQAEVRALILAFLEANQLDQ
jgi:dienelactone hydrolase